jgi:hypothetical protein
MKLHEFQQPIRVNSAAEGKISTDSMISFSKRRFVIRVQGQASTNINTDVMINICMDCLERD